MSDTPRTDAVREQMKPFRPSAQASEMYDHARKLEREVAALKRNQGPHFDSIDEITIDRYRWIECENKRMRAALKKAEHHLILILNSVDQDEQEAFIACGRAAIEEALKGGAA